MENNQSLSVSGVKREAKGLLTNNWSRALSALCISLLALVLFLLINNFVLSLVNLAGDMNNGTGETQPHTILEFYKYFISDNKKSNIILSGILAAFYFVMVSPLRLGVINWYQSLAICGNLQVGQVFYFYRTNELFKEALIFELARLARNAAVMVISFCPSAVCFGMAISASKAAQKNTMLLYIAAGAALLIVGMIVYAVVVLRWFVAKYLYVSGREYGVGECFRNSSRYMKKHIGRIMLIIFTCIPLWLSCIFVLPALYVIPYYNAVMAAAAQDIIDENVSDVIQ